MFRMSFNVDGEQQMQRFLDLAADSVNDFSTVFDKLADEFRQSQEQVFANSGAFEGRSGWRKLSPNYRKWKSQHYPGKPILTLRGDLRKSLTQKGGNHIERITANSMVIGTKDKKAVWHHRGTSKMPKRKVIELTEPQKRRWVQIAHTEIFENLMSPNERTAHRRGLTPGRR